MAEELTSPNAAGARARALVPAVLFAVLLGVCGVTLYKIQHRGLDLHEIKSPLIGRPAPVFRLPSLADPTVMVSNETFAGRPYLVNVWGTWCGECRAEHGVLLEIARRAELPVIGLDWRDERGIAGRYLATLGNPYSVVASDDDGRVAIDWGVYGAPETFLVGADGQIKHKHVGALSIDVWEHDFVPRLKAGTAAVAAVTP